MEVIMVETYFDTVERTVFADIVNKNKFVSSYEIIMQMLESYPQIALILDQNRQIVAANENAMKFLEVTNLEKVLGKRLGEALNCIHAFEMKAGCGTSIFCTECGAAKSIKDAKDNDSSFLYECRVTAKKNNVIIALDLRVKTTPLILDNHKFLLVYAEDIQSEKRKSSLERVFFHDVLNTAGVINNIAEILSDVDSEEDRNIYLEMLKNSAQQLINEISFQRMIISAENQQLNAEFKMHNVNSILESAYLLYSKHQKAEGKIFTVDYLDNDLFIETDKMILVRSLGNLIKNALEATKDGDKVRLYAEIKSDWVNFNIWNEGVIPEDVQLQIFQRSFSTKAKEGRGIGTYSVKLFIENFLKGKVYFNSSPNEQTCFTISLPTKIN
jgi:K+-sensing histidine kinase KdpD